MTHKINIMVLLLCIALFTGCLTAKNLDKQVAIQYTNIPAPQKNKPEDHIAITTTLAIGNTISESVTKTSKMLPLIVYWQWNYDNPCTLNAQLPISSFSSTVLSPIGAGVPTQTKSQ